MEQNSVSTGNATAFRILVVLSISHCLNDSLQAVISASYPVLKDEMTLSFAQIGLITLVYQMAASIFQPITGLFFDRRPVTWALPIGMTSTLIGLLSLAFATSLHWVLGSVFLIGIGSSVFHPEAARITSLASGANGFLHQYIAYTDILQIYLYGKPEQLLHVLSDSKVWSQRAGIAGVVVCLPAGYGCRDVDGRADR